jgi:phage repressor protein C with HTH and peptisase S24 domain
MDANVDRENLCDLPSRISYLTEKVGGPAVMAERLGVTTTTLLRWRKGETEPTATLIILMAGFGGESVEWLLNGSKKKQPEFNVIESLVTSTPSLLDTLGNKVDPDDFIFIPRYDVFMSAGTGTFWQEECLRDVIAFRRDWIRRYIDCSSPENLVAVIVTGDSMEPTLFNNDTIIVDRGTTTLKDKDGIYAFILDERRQVKRLQRHDDGCLLAISDNPAHLSRHILDEDLEGFIICGRVCCRLPDKPPTSY